MHNVVVTGGSRGIGLAIATTLAAAGYRAIAIARTESEELRCAIAARDGQGGAVSFRAFDLSDIAAIAGLVGSLREEFGPLYGLVNNAGIGTSGMLTLMRDEQIEELARLNMIAPIILTKYVLRGMMVERAGRSEEHTSELQSQSNLVCRLLLEKKKKVSQRQGRPRRRSQRRRHPANPRCTVCRRSGRPARYQDTRLAGRLRSLSPSRALCLLVT